MTDILTEIMNIINFDLVFATGLMILVFFAAKKLDIKEKRKSVELRDKEPEVVWIAK
jgi:hypothetical protein